MENKKIIIWFIGMIIVAIVVFFVIHLSNRNADKLNNNSNNGIEEKTLLEIINEDSGEVVDTDNKQKYEYNEIMLESSAFKYLLKIGKVATTSVDGNKFTDKQKLSFATSYAYGEEYDKLVENSKSINEEAPSYINFEYLNEISKKYFNEGIIKENLSNEFDGEYILVSLPTSVPADLYKFKEIKYNAQSDVYSIYFDEIDPEAKNYYEIEKNENIEYSSEDVLDTYRILYKKVNDRNIVLGIHKVS